MILAESQQRGLLLRAWGDEFELLHAGVTLVRVPIPRWEGPLPLAAAKMVLRLMRPAPPGIEEKESATPHAWAFYNPCLDRIFMVCKGSSEAVQAALIVHEVIHATGHAKRLNRPFMAYGAEELKHDFAAWVQEQDSPKPYAMDKAPFPQLSIAEREEELTASLGTAMLLPMLGLAPAGGSSGWREWFARADSLPIENIRQAITDAQAAVDYLLSPPACLQGNLPAPSAYGSAMTEDASRVPPLKSS